MNDYDYNHRNAQFYALIHELQNPLVDSNILNFLNAVLSEKILQKQYEKRKIFIRNPAPILDEYRKHRKGGASAGTAKIRCIQLWRVNTGDSLAEAKREVERILNETPKA